MSVAGVVHDAEVRIALGPHRVHDFHHFGGLIEQKARLELPGQIHTVVGGDLAALVPDRDDAVKAELRVHAGSLEEVGRLDRIDADGLDAEVGRRRL